MSKVLSEKVKDAYRMQLDGNGPGALNAALILFDHYLACTQRIEACVCFNIAWRLDRTRASAEQRTAHCRTWNAMNSGQRRVVDRLMEEQVKKRSQGIVSVGKT